MLLLNGLPYVAADSPTPFSVTNSRAIAVSTSSSSSIPCRPSLENLPSMASETKSFLPIRRRHDRLHRLVVSQETDDDVRPLTDSPGSAACLSQSVDRVPGLHEVN